MSKALLHANGTFRELVPDEASTAPDQTRVWVPTEPPTVPDNEVLVELDPLITETEAIQQWTTRPKTADELRKTWSCLEFIARLLPEEIVGLWTYAPTLMAMLLSAHEVYDDDPLTIYGLNQAVAGELITEARKNQILE